MPEISDHDAEMDRLLAENRELKRRLAVDHNYFGYAHTLPPTDERREHFAQQRLERGFDSSELWNLDCTIAKFILPRLRAFAADSSGVPYGTDESEWASILAKMIEAFDRIANYWSSTTKDLKAQDEKIERGLDLFRRYYRALWN